MKYVKIFESDTLTDLTERVGTQNIDQILADNGLARMPKVGKQWANIVDNIYNSTENVSSQRKQTILNQFVDNLDIYEEVALSGERAWKVISSKMTLPDRLYVADQIEDSIPLSSNVLGNKISVPSSIYNKVNSCLIQNLNIDPGIFSDNSVIQNPGILADSTDSGFKYNPMSWFKLPIDTILLYSSIDGTSIGIPAYPEDISDSRVANYTQMPDLLYQYEPWQMYQSSGPRSCTYEFHLHRDMWSGNHLDGKANELIRYCQAQCYPKYNGSAVITPTVTLYVAGSNLITGILTQVDVDWAGPIGQDDWYLEFTLRLSITEVSPAVLNYSSVLSKPLIG